MEKVLVIGGSSGMGLGTATLLAASGYEVAIASRSTSKLEAALSKSGAAQSYVLDTRDEKGVAAFFETSEIFDHIVISAADFTTGSLNALSLEKARAFFDSKFWGQYVVAKYGSKKINKGGSLTFFSGILSQRPLKNMAVAASINGAIESLTRALALELAPLRVNAIAPGTVITPVWDVVPEKERASYFEEAGKKIPIGRVGKVEDVALAIKFLIECKNMTGEVLFCEGGARLV